MSKAELKAAVEATHTLKRMQERPDSPEALATIPTLKIADLPEHNKTIPIEVGDAARHAGALSRSLHQRRHLSRRRLRPAYAAGGPPPLRVAVRPRAARDRCRQRGFRPAVAAHRPLDRRHPAAALDVGGARPPDLRGMVQPARQGAAGADRRAARRSCTTFSHARASTTANGSSSWRWRRRQRSSRGWCPAGSSYVDRRLRANFFESDWADEQMGGVSYLFFLRKLVEQVETGWDGVLAALERIRATLFNRAAMLCNVTAVRRTGTASKPQLAEFLGALPHTPAKPAPWQVADTPRAEGLVDPGQGQLCRQGRRPLSRRRQAERRPYRRPPLSPHHLAVGQDPGAGRRLWRAVHVRPLLRRLHLRVLPRPQPAGHPRHL